MLRLITHFAQYDRQVIMRPAKRQWVFACSITSPLQPSMHWMYVVLSVSRSLILTFITVTAPKRFFQHPFYPYSGAEQPSANMVNVPVPAHSYGNAIRELVTEKWLLALREFKPEMIFISAGFDAHREDDMGQLGLVEADYAWMTRQIMEIANEFALGRIVSCLEGGYNLSALGRSVIAHVKTLADLE